MHEFKSDVVRYCNNFQEGKCKFGEKCKYKHEINPNFKKEDIFINNKNKNNVYNKNNKNKAQVKRNSNSNNYKGNNNHNNSQQRFKVTEGQPPKYSNQNSIPLRNLITMEILQTNIQIIIIQIGYSLKIILLQILILECMY